MVICTGKEADVFVYEQKAIPNRMKKFNPRNLSESALELIAARFKALSEVNRLRIIIALEDGEKNVTTLIDRTGLTQANLSRHLQTLVEAGILARRKEGLAVFYRIADPSIFKLCDQVCGGIARHMETQAKAFHA
jgi:DNA-binding transcriptional ArsR family regulator